MRVGDLAVMAVVVVAVNAAAAPPATAGLPSAVGMPPLPPDVVKILKAADGIAERESNPHVVASFCDALVFILNDYFTKAPGLPAQARTDGTAVLRQIAIFGAVYLPEGPAHPEWKQQWSTVRLNLTRVLEGFPP